LLAT